LLTHLAARDPELAGPSVSAAHHFGSDWWEERTFLAHAQTDAHGPIRHFAAVNCRIAKAYEQFAALIIQKLNFLYVG
jgi:hypothetical protein